MTARIQNRYGSLAKCLDLMESPGPFVLDDFVIPVILICQNYQFEPITLHLIGAASGSTIESVPLVAGMYDVSWTISAGSVLASINVSELHLRNIPGGSDFLHITGLRIVTTGNMVQSGRAIVKATDGNVLALTVDGGGVGNSAEAWVVAQPV